jgi:hypothetical protein
MIELEARLDDGSQRCRVRTKNGRQCMMPALEGRVYCEYHRPATERNAIPADTHERAAIVVGGEMRTPREAAAWLLARTLDEVPPPTTRAGHLAADLRGQINRYLQLQGDPAPNWRTVREALAIVGALVDAKDPTSR